MLELYERHSPPADGEIIRNPEAAFLELRVTRSNLTETLMREIDKAEYVNEVLFIDRFGCTIPISRLSTGCKTAIVVEHNPGYSTLTFTVTVHEERHSVDAGGIDGIDNIAAVYGKQDPETTKTYTADISGCKKIQICVASGFSCNAEVTNIYLS